ncbi:hypothetical protein, partial [Dermacoccus nishinomiyaensis]|uniref:hypothetical protein n=1 Tax=Dermacoccus nishinomiyaensis TaxID=1274 RepID=UPI001C92C35E
RVGVRREKSRERGGGLRKRCVEGGVEKVLETGVGVVERRGRKVWMIGGRGVGRGGVGGLEGRMRG